jgi:hypothetical protein
MTDPHFQAVKMKAQTQSAGRVLRTQCGDNIKAYNITASTVYA